MIRVISLILLAWLAGGATELRRPVAMTMAGEQLITANRDSGTISVVEPGRGEVVGELAVGGRPVDVVADDGGKSLLVADEDGGTLIKLGKVGTGFKVLQRIAIGTSPVAARVSPAGRLAAVSLLWARRVAVVDLDRFSVVRTIDLPFPPRAQWWAADGKTLLVADAFGGELAVIDPLAGTVRSLRSIHGHNIRGLAGSPDGRELLIAHPMLEDNLSTEHSHVFWGSLMGNVVRGVAVDHLLAATADPMRPTPIAHWTLASLGESKLGAGDPSDVAWLADGTVVVALSGVDQIAVRRPGGMDFARIVVGRGPVVITPVSSGERVYVANRFDDSISEVDLATLTVCGTIRLGARRAAVTLTAEQRGEMLFHDARLSLDGWYSCHSCHSDGHTNGRLNDNLSDGTFGTPKGIPSLLGVEGTAPFAWNGGNAALEEQVRKSILNTMQGTPASARDENVADIAAYLRTLSPPPSVRAARGTTDVAAVGRGRLVFDRMDCARCHEPPSYTTAKTYDVHLRDESGLARFNPPSLRGAGQRDRFLHDGRAGSLEELFTRFRHPDGDGLGDSATADLAAFLRSL
jgi:YVTN family beta-propeller protein